MIRPTLLALSLTLLTTVSAAADEVRLANGDRFTGRVVSLDGGVLSFTTAHGDLHIPWSDVTRLSVDEPILATIADTEPAQVTIVASDTEREVTLQPGGPRPLSDILALMRPQPTLVVAGGANAGFVTTAGNTDVNNVRLDGDVMARIGDNRYTGSAALTRAHDRGLETARNWTAGVKYDRFLTQRLFVTANTILTNDRFRDLDLRTAAGAGLGYQVLALARVGLTADGGFGYVNENLEGQPDDSYSAARESASLDVSVIPDRVQFFHQHDGYFGLTGEDNLFVRMQNGVRLGLVAGFVTTLRHDLDYDRSPAPGRRTTDRTLSMTLGYRF